MPALQAKNVSTFSTLSYHSMPCWELKFSFSDRKVWLFHPNILAKPEICDVHEENKL